MSERRPCEIQGTRCRLRKGEEVAHWWTTPEGALRDGRTRGWAVQGDDGKLRCSQGVELQTDTLGA